MLGTANGSAAARAVAIVLAFAAVFVHAEAANAEPATQSVKVSIEQPTPAVHPGESIHVAVGVSLSAPAEYLEVRIRLRTPEGKLVYQKTEVRSEVAPGRHVVMFERSASAPKLRHGRYPIEVRVLATGSEPTDASGRVLVVEAPSQRQTASIIARVWWPPTVDANGRFAVDPDAQSQLSDQISGLSTIAASHRLPLGLVLPPVLVEELGGSAYDHKASDGTAPVSVEQETGARSSQALHALKTAIESGSLSLVDVPYAVPDLAGLASIGAESDLLDHWTHGDAVILAALNAHTRPQVAYLGTTPTRAGLDSLAERGASSVLLPPGSVTVNGKPESGGVHNIAGTRLLAIVPDADASAAVDLGEEEFFDILFERFGEDPIILMVDLGPDTEHPAANVERALQWLSQADWLQLTAVDSLKPAAEADEASLPAHAQSLAPQRHWDAVLEARAALEAYRECVAADDPDAKAATRAVLVSESQLWAGSNGTWDEAGKAAALARGVKSFVSSEFEKIRFEAKDVMLSGSTGQVPLTIVNDTGKRFTVTIVARVEGQQEPQHVKKIVLEPTENFVTIPVDLRNSISTKLEVSAVSAGQTIAMTTIDVHTSYIDRFATVGMVVLFLVVLLFIIRRRARSADADTIRSDRDTDGRHKAPSPDDRV